jgi:hypothetical protein
MHPIIARILSRYYTFRLNLYLRSLPQKPNNQIWPRGYP